MNNISDNKNISNEETNNKYSENFPLNTNSDKSDENFNNINFEKSQNLSLNFQKWSNKTKITASTWMNESTLLVENVKEMKKLLLNTVFQISNPVMFYFLLIYLIIMIIIKFGTLSCISSVTFVNSKENKTILNNIIFLLSGISLILQLGYLTLNETNDNLNIKE